jgi:hypothetical protein
VAYEKRKLWEILVPTVRNSGKPFRTRFHKVWDENVRKISGGMTILTPSKGQWMSPEGELFIERMIPVRVLATTKEINEIIDYTLTYYEQTAILAYVISNEYILKYRKGEV